MSPSDTPGVEKVAFELGKIEIDGPVAEDGTVERVTVAANRVVVAIPEISGSVVVDGKGYTTDNPFEIAALRGAEGVVVKSSQPKGGAKDSTGTSDAERLDEALTTPAPEDLPGADSDAEEGEN